MDNKRLLKEINYDIDVKSNEKELIGSIEDELNVLNHEVNDCINLISNCVKGKKVNEIITNLSIQNDKLIKETNNVIVEDKNKLKDELNDLNNKQQLIIDKLNKE